jgi:DNA ligase-1
LQLWLDPHEPQSGPERVFVSHAHSDHTGLHREVILSEPTSRLMHARLSGEWMEHTLPFLEPRQFEAAPHSFTITLLPAGHIFGSAMSLIESGGESLLYTGDFKLRPGLSAEACQPRNADILVMETTYGRPEYQFPPTNEVMQGVIRFCREALDNDETPVLLGYSLGKSQELLCGLGDAGLPIMLHGQVHKLTQIYQDFGQCFPPFEKYESGSARGKVLLCPPSAARSGMLRGAGTVRLAVLTGWAVEPNCRYRYGADAAFPISDHADFPDLVEFVKRVNPRKVYTLHGFAADFASTLRDLGWDAQALSEEEQLALPLGTLPAGRRTPRRGMMMTTVEPKGEPQALRESIRPWLTSLEDGTSAPSTAAFHQFARVCAEMTTTTRKLEKIRMVAEFLKTLNPSDLARVATWLTGNAFPPSQSKVLQLGWALIRDALCDVGGLDQSSFGQVYLKHSDLGETAYEILVRSAPVGPSLSIAAVELSFEQLHAARGPIAKLPLIVRTLREGTALEGKYLIKILTGDLRIGLKEGLVEEAIASAFNAPLNDVKNANLLLGNIGETARLAREGSLHSVSLTPFRPVKFMLASPEETAVEIWTRVREWSQTVSAATGAGVGDSAQMALAPAPATVSQLEERSDLSGWVPAQVWIEDKYDGIRAQLHKVGSKCAFYSRDLKEITSTFFDLADAARAISDDVVLDGEIVAMRGAQVLPFSELQKRLGRREDDLFLREEIPVRFIVFDVLWSNGRTFLNEPLRARRETLERVAGMPPLFGIAPLTRAGSPEEIESAFAAARHRDNEGLIIKDPASLYTPGRRGLAWLKLKKAFATLDCVVVGAEYGHGKRKDVLSDYTFAVRDESTGELKTIGKAYSGLTDVEIAELTRHFLGKVIAQRGRFHAVLPDTVLEIAFDSIQPSRRHNSGLAMRFPRIVRIRTDKTPAEIDTLTAARRLVQSPSGKSRGAEA